MTWAFRVALVAVVSVFVVASFPVLYERTISLDVHGIEMQPMCSVCRQEKRIAAGILNADNGEFFCHQCLARHPQHAKSTWFPQIDLQHKGTP